MFGLETIVQEREAQVRDAINSLNQEANDQAKLRLLLSALAEIREAIAESVVDKVTVTNQDEIKAALHNELSRISKPIIAAIEKLSINRAQIDSIKKEIESKNKLVLEENFDLQIIKKPKQRMTIDNLSDFSVTFPDSFDVRNLSELKGYFEDLAQVFKSFKIDIPTPQVTVNPPNVVVPEINIPEANVNIDLSQVIEALDPLKYLSDRANKPLAVRLSDGQHFLKTLSTIIENQQKQVAAFSQGMNVNDMRAALKAGVNISTVFSGGVELTPKFAKIDAATSGNNTIVAAVTGKKIRVLQVFLVAAGTVTTRFESGADGTALTGQMNLIANTGYSLPFSPVGLFETVAGDLLNLELSSADSVDGSLVYVEV